MLSVWTRLCIYYVGYNYNFGLALNYLLYGLAKSGAIMTPAEVNEHFCPLTAFLDRLYLSFTLIMGYIYWETTER